MPRWLVCSRPVAKRHRGFALVSHMEGEAWMTVEKTRLASVWLAIALAASSFLSIPLFSARAASVEDVSMMKSAERLKLLVEGAKLAKGGK